MLEFIFSILMILTFLLNIVILACPFFMQTWLEHKLGGLLSSIVSGMVYILSFALGIFLLLKIAPSIKMLEDEIYITIMNTLFFVFQFIVLGTVYKLTKKPA